MAKNTESTTSLSDDLTIVSIDHEAGEVLVDRSGRECGPKARFAPGMDARTKGTLQTAFRLGYEIRHADGVTKSAHEWAAEYGYERFLTAKPKKAKKASRKQQALAITEVKVGRHWYKIDEARISTLTAEGGDLEIDYTTAKGESKTTKVPAAQVTERTR
jgi:hypothetical protein